MKLSQKTILSYENFNLLSNDIIALAKEVMPDKVIYINFLNDDIQVTMKVSDHDTKVGINEGDTIDVINAICNNIDYTNIKPLVIEDTSKVNYSTGVINTIKDGNIGSYLGIPIVLKSGERFGALCAAHHDKSSFNNKDIELLEKIARLFSYYLDLENIAYQDYLTKLFNTQYLSIHQGDMIKNGGFAIFVDLDNFKIINDNLGHNIGDLVLKEVGSKLRNFGLNFKDIDIIRFGGDEFFIYIKDELEDETIISYLKHLVRCLAKWETDINNLPLSSSVGAYKFLPNEFNSFTKLLSKTDKLLYKAKSEGKNRFVYEK